MTLNVRLGFAYILIILTFWTPPSSARKFSAKEIARAFFHAAKHYPKNITEPTGSLTMKQVIDKKKGTTMYYLQSDDGEYDPKSKPAFVRSKVDAGLKWLFIPKLKDRLYDWEKQSIVVLRRIPGKKDLYSALIIHFRVLAGNKLVYEWDDWRPRGYAKKDDCPCSLVDKFYRYCGNWTFCDLQYNTYDVSDDDSVADTRRRRKATKETVKPVEQVEVRNRMPPGTKQAFGPFFWELVDDESEQGEMYTQMIEFAKMTPEKFKYEEEVDDVPFSGYGDCPYWVKVGDFDEAQKSQSPILLLQFLSKAVRMQCIAQKERDIMYDLFKETLLYWDTKRGDVFFNTSHHFTTAVNIDEFDLLNLEKALHTSAFSRIYGMVTKAMKNEKGNEKIRDAVSPLGKKIHRNTRMTVLMTIKIFEMIQTSLKQHAIKLVKRLIANLKNTIMHNVQKVVSIEKDGKGRAACDKNSICAEKVKMIRKDQTQIVSLIYFMLFGTDPELINEVFDDKEGDTFDSWKTLAKYGQFYEYHVKFLDKCSSMYFEPSKS